MTTPWPLSAPATALLRSLKTPCAELLRLGVRELVLTGAWRVKVGPPTQRRFGRQPARDALLGPGERPAPQALSPLDAALRSNLPSASLRPARVVVAAALQRNRHLPKAVQEQARWELLQLGLVSERPGPFGLGTRLGPTATGRAWQATLDATLAAWSRGLQQGGSSASSVLRAASAAPGLLLAANPSLLAELDRELRRVRSSKQSGGEGAVPGSSDSGTSTAGPAEFELNGLLDVVEDRLDGLRGLGSLDFGVPDGGGGPGGGDGGDGGGGGD